MDQTVEQIEAEIGRARHRLGANLHELQDKVETATDWRGQLRSRPWLILGAACVGGMVAATAFRPRGGGMSRLNGLLDGPRSNAAMSQVSDLWTDVTTALVGVASTQVKDYIGAVVPGFTEHFDRAGRHRS